jgi:hypothetical protein
MTSSTETPIPATWELMPFWGPPGSPREKSTSDWRARCPTCRRPLADFLPLPSDRGSYQNTGFELRGDFWYNARTDVYEWVYQVRRELAFREPPLARIRVRANGREEIHLTPVELNPRREYQIRCPGYPKRGQRRSAAQPCGQIVLLRAPVLDVHTDAATITPVDP